MTEVILCKICGKRRARRACPAVSGDICTICCGTEREVSLTCPLDCSFLEEAHRREKPIPLQLKSEPFPDVEVSESFLTEHEELLLYAIYTLLQSALRTAGAIDADVISALDALIRTYRTLESGLVYESRPENSIAAEIQRLFARSLDDYLKVRNEEEPLRPIRNSEISKVLVFLCRIGQINQNGRPRGRMFIGLLRRMTPDRPAAAERPSGIII